MTRRYVTDSLSFETSPTGDNSSPVVIILHRQQHHQHLLQRQSLRRNAGIVIDVCHNLMLHKKIHQLVPILPILRYHPQVVIKKSIAHIPLYPSLSRRRCRHFPLFPNQLPEFVRLHVIPWVCFWHSKTQTKEYRENPKGS